MKKTLFLCLGLLITFGCAKKQMIKPVPPVVAETPKAPVAAPSEPSKDESSVRFTDWTQVPDIGSVSFDYDKFELTTEDRNTLKKNADYLNSNPDVNVLVEGNCDERGTIEYNLALGQKRAAAVREYYGQLGVALGRVGTISYGSEKPVDPAHTEDAWAKNRRAETKIRSTKKTVDNSAKIELPKDTAAGNQPEANSVIKDTTTISNQAPVNPATTSDQTPDNSKTKSQ